MIVADTNLIAYLLIPGEHTALAERVRARDNSWIAPPLWRSEFRNVLGLHLRHGRLDLEAALELAAAAERMMEGRGVEVDTRTVLHLASASGCTAYDCEFVVLAQKAGVPLVTADKKVIAAFPSTAVSPEGFLS